MALRVLQLRWADYDDAFDVLIDGVPLVDVIRQHAPDLDNSIDGDPIFWNEVGTARPGWTAFDPEVLVPGFEGRALVTMCGCGDGMCSSQFVTVRTTEDTVTWSKYDHWLRGLVYDIPPIIFSRAQYANEVRAAAARAAEFNAHLAATRPPNPPPPSDGVPG